MSILLLETALHINPKAFKAKSSQICGPTMPTAHSVDPGFAAKHRDLAHLAGQADYRQWIFKLQAWLIRCGQDDFLASSSSSKPEDRLTTTTTVSTPVPVTDVNGNTYVDANGQIVTRDRVVTHPALETDQVLGERCAAWTSFNLQLQACLLWSERARFLL
jgi:hypothetical protein